MKTPLIIVLVIVAGMLGFLTIYSQQRPAAQVTQVQGAAGAQAVPAAGGDGAAGAHAAPAAGGDGKQDFCMQTKTVGDK